MNLSNIKEKALSHLTACHASFVKMPNAASWTCLTRAMFIWQQLWQANNPSNENLTPLIVSACEMQDKVGEWADIISIVLHQKNYDALMKECS